MRNLRMGLWLAAVLSVVSLPAVAQYGGRDRDWDDRGGWHRRVYDNPYEEGFRDGRRDAMQYGRREMRNDSRWRGRDRRDYVQGYNQGFEDAMRTSSRRGGYGGPYRGPYGGYPSGPYGDRGGVYGQPNVNWAEQARQVGYQDGVNDGASDRRTGHSFRPTHDDNYKNADRGYNSSFGDKNTYKQYYRQGYESGYQRGWNETAR